MIETIGRFVYTFLTQKTLKIFLRITLFLSTFVSLFFLLYPSGYFVLGPDLPPVASQAPLTSPQVTLGKVDAYVINLDRAPERYASVKNLVEDLGFSTIRLSATDGRTLSSEEIREKVDTVAYEKLIGHSPQVGTIGCYLSHLKAWQTFLESDAEFALIFEDDIHFDPTKLRMTVVELLQNTHLWDIVNFDLWRRGNPLTILTLRNKQKLVTYLEEVTHAGAYLINRSAAQKLTSKALPIKIPVDHYFIRSWEFGLKFTGIENPRLVTQTFGDSHIMHSRHVSDQPLPWFYVLTRKLYRFQSSIAWFFYNLKTYISAKV